MNSAGAPIRPFYRNTDWVLLGFLLLFTNQAMLSVKLAGLLAIYLARPNLRFGFFKGRLPLFYLAMPLLGLINLVAHVRDFSTGYLSAFAVAMGFWACCVAGYHQVKLSLERRGPATMHNTLRAWVVLNFAVSIGQLIRIAMKTGKLNPYEGLGFPYGMSTGDRIFGILFENSYYNLIISAMLAIYFLFRRDYIFTMLAAFCLLLVFGNAGTYVFLAALAGIFAVSVIQLIVRRKSGQKNSLLARIIQQASPGRPALLLAPMLMAICIVFPLVVSPENAEYATNSPGVLHPDTAQSPANPEATINIRQLNFKKYEHPRLLSAAADSSDIRRRRLLTRNSINHLTGKKLSLQETIRYMQSSVPAMLLGAGPARFSSLSAHYVSGADTGRLFRLVPDYRSRAYAENHLMISEFRVTSEARLLSTLNWPECFYNQLLGEYGIAGFIVFALLYAGYFLRRARRLSFGWWISIMLLPFALLSYLFETLCLMTFYELLMEQDLAIHPEQSEAASRLA